MVASPGPKPPCTSRDKRHAPLASPILYQLTTRHQQRNSVHYDLESVFKVDPHLYLDDTRDVLPTPLLWHFQRQREQEVVLLESLFPPLFTQYNKAKYNSKSHEPQYNAKVFPINLSGIPHLIIPKPFPVGQGLETGCAHEQSKKLCLAGYEQPLPFTPLITCNCQNALLMCSSNSFTVGSIDNRDVCQHRKQVKSTLESLTAASQRTNAYTWYLV